MAWYVKYNVSEILFDLYHNLVLIMKVTENCPWNGEFWVARQLIFAIYSEYIFDVIRYIYLMKDYTFSSYLFSFL